MPLTKEDMIPKAETLPSKEERLEQKREQEKANQDVEIIKNLLMEFVNEKLLPLDIPVAAILNDVPQLLTALVKVYATKSTAYKAYIDAKRNYEDTAIKDLERVA